MQADLFLNCTSAARAFVRKAATVFIADAPKASSSSTAGRAGPTVDRNSATFCRLWIDFCMEVVQLEVRNSGPVGISEVRYFTFSPHSPSPDSSSGSPSGSAAPGLTQVRPIRSVAPGGYSMIAIPPTSRDRETQLLFPSRARGCRGSSIAVPLHVATPVPSCGIAVDRPKRGLQLLRVLSTTYM